MNRRHVMLAAAAALAAGVAVPLEASARAFGAAGPARRSARSALNAIAICDARYSDSRRFASALRERGAQVFTTEQGLVDLWRDVFAAQASRREMRMAGLTTRCDFEVMRMCAREAGLKVSYEANHDSRDSQHLRHDIRTCSSEHVIAPLRNGRSDWVEALAFALAMPSASEIGRLPEPPELRRAADHPGFLTSWLMEPLAKLTHHDPKRAHDLQPDYLSRRD